MNKWGYHSDKAFLKRVLRQARRSEHTSKLDVRRARRILSRGTLRLARQIVGMGEVLRARG